MVKCADCGFLASRLRQTRDLVETEIRLRESWNQFIAMGSSNLYALRPVCFVRAADFEVEMGGPPIPPAPDAINRERDCDKFTPWMQGFSPKEHKEMLSDAEMKKWQAAESERQRAFEAKQTKILLFGGLIASLATTILGFVLGKLK